MQICWNILGGKTRWCQYERVKVYLAWLKIEWNVQHKESNLRATFLDDYHILFDRIQYFLSYNHAKLALTPDEYANISQTEINVNIYSRKTSSKTLNAYVG